MPRQTEEHPRYEMAVSAHDVTLGYAGPRTGSRPAPPAATESSTCSTPPHPTPEEPPCLS